MLGEPFINAELSNAIELYLKYKTQPENPIFQSFLVVVIRTLVAIYGELDILNPYITKNEKMLGGWNTNLTKFGFPLEKLDDFKKQFTEFVKSEQNNEKPNIPFIKIEKTLILMFFYRHKDTPMPPEEQQKILNLLYLPTNQNQKIQSDLANYTTNPLELTNYFQSVNYEFSHNFTIQEEQRTMLIHDAYQLLGYTMDRIENLTDQDLAEVNKQVYNFFQVDIDAQDKEELLIKAVNYYKRYGNRITSGNGYIDFLLFLSIIATAIFIVILAIFR